MVIFGKFLKIKTCRFKHKFEWRNIESDKLIDAKSVNNANNNI